LKGSVTKENYKKNRRKEGLNQKSDCRLCKKKIEATRLLERKGGKRTALLWQQRRRGEERGEYVAWFILDEKEKGMTMTE